MKKQILLKVLTAVIAGASLLGTPSMIAYARNGAPNTGTGQTFFSVANVSSTSATVVAAYYGQDGTTDYTDSSHTINALGRRDYDLGTDTPLGSGWTGSVILSADQDIIAQAITRYTRTPLASCGAVADDGVEFSDYEAANTASTILYAPAIFRPSNDTIATKIAVQNTTLAAADVYVNFYNRSGVYRGTIVKSAVGGGRSFSIDVANDTQIPSAFIADNDGSLYITSTAQLVGVVDSVQSVSVPCQHYQFAYTMATPTQIATTLYHPSIFRVARPSMTILGTGLASKTRLGSSMQIQNTSLGASANVTITFINRATGSISLTLNTTIAPNSAIGINTTLGSSSFPTSTFIPLGDNFAGSAVINSDQPLVGAGIFESPEASVGNEQDYSDQFLLPTASDATNTIYVPRMDRVCAVVLCSSTSSTANWTQFSAVQIINVDANPVTLSSIDFYSTAGGSAILSFTSGTTLTLQPGQAVGVNLRNGGNFPKLSFDTLGNNFNGIMRVTAPNGSKLKAVFNTVFSSLGQTIGNAQNR